MSFAKDIRTVPNLITVSRLIIMTIAPLLWFDGQYVPAIILGVIAAITDYADGIVARRTGQVTYLGAILDQFADLITECIILLMLISHPDGLHPVIFLIYLFREFWVSTIRRFMMAHKIDIKSSFLGKLKTNFIGWGCILWFVHLAGFATWAEPVMFWLAQLGVYGGLVLAYLSGLSYTRQFVAGYNTIEPV